MNEEGTFVAWKATINKLAFPNIKLSSGVNSFHLDENKYKDSFKLFLQMFGSIPSTLFDYNVFVNGEDIVITGLSETTVRIAIVDLTTGVVPGASVKMVRPPTNFRVYEPITSSTNPTSNSSQETQLDELEPLGNIFGTDGDY
jgi:hypothetical protein